MKIDNLYFKSIFFLALCTFSVFINYYYANFGAFPIDTFAYFDTGYNILNGKHPFKDTWVTVGPLVDYLQAGIFKIFGISWSSYVLHGSIFNLLITLTIFLSLQKFGLKFYYSLFYSFSVATLCYPLSGTPFADQHSIIMSFISLMIFYLAIKTEENNFWFFLPIVMGLSFFCKQVPSSYINIIIILFGIFYFIKNYNLKKIKYLFSGSIFFLIIIIAGFVYLKIPFDNFLDQYILFPLSLGEYRVSEYASFSFRNFIGHFKFVHLFLLLLIIIFVSQILSKKKKLNKNDLIINLSIIFVILFLIFHQVNIFNQTYIFFIIPIFAGFSQIFLQKIYVKDKIHTYLIPILILFITLKYHYEYNENRKFMDLQNVNFNEAIDAKIIDKKLNNLKWITPFFNGSPNKEIKLLEKSIDIIKKDSRKKILITHYQFISALINQNTNTLNRWYTHNNVSYPLLNHKYYELYKNFILNKIIDNGIEVIYVMDPIKFENFTIFINKNCINSSQENLILTSHEIVNCENLGKI